MVEVVRGVEAVPGGESAVVDVFDRAFAGELGGARSDFLPRQFSPHQRREGFALAGAVDDGDLVGFAYGYTGQHGQYWTDWIASKVSATLAAEWLGGHFELVELAVVPEARRRGIGELLLAALLEGRAEPRALLTTWRHEHAARRLYERTGWRELIPDVDEHTALYGRLLRPREGSS